MRPTRLGQCLLGLAVSTRIGGPSLRAQSCPLPSDTRWQNDFLFLRNFPPAVPPAAPVLIAGTSVIIDGGESAGGLGRQVTC